MSATFRAHHQALIAELAEAAMAMARKISERALAAETIEETVELAAAHEKVARSVRLSIALHEKLERAGREAARAARHDADYGLSPGDLAQRRRIEARAEAVRAAVRRSIAQDVGETEGERIAGIEHALGLVLAEHSLTPQFETRSLFEVVSDIRETLGLSRDIMIDIDGEADGEVDLIVPDRCAIAPAPAPFPARAAPS